MKLTEQLKQTSKWNEFEKWFDETYTKNYMLRTCSSFQYPGTYLDFEYWCDFPFEFQEGVFKKYLEQDSVIAKYRTHWNISVLKEDYLIQDDFDTFEEIILWYFNN